MVVNLKARTPHCVLDWQCIPAVHSLVESAFNLNHMADHTISRLSFIGA